MPPPRTIRCGGCRCGGPTTRCWNPRSPTSTMSAAAAMPARSRRRCSCAASSARRRGCISTSSPGARPPAGAAGRRRMPGRARDLCSARRALWLTPAMPAFDPRLTPARADLAAKASGRQGQGGALCRGARLRGDRAAGAGARDACAGRAADDRSAQGRARHDLRDECRRLGLGPARRRRLCRLAAGECAGARRRAANPQGRRRCARSCFPGPSIKLPPLEALPLGARLAIARVEERLAVTRSGAYVPAPHLAPLDAVEPDFVAVAERFLGVPYLWGGKTALGLDCSGLVQVALTAAGIACPRDSDMQEAALGAPVAPRRGGGSAPRRSHLLEGPCRHRARPRHADSRQRLSHGGRDRAARGSGRAHPRCRQRNHQRAADRAFGLPAVAATLPSRPAGVV